MNRVKAIVILFVFALLAGCAKDGKSKETAQESKKEQLVLSETENETESPQNGEEKETDKKDVEPSVDGEKKESNTKTEQNSNQSSDKKENKPVQTPSKTPSQTTSQTPPSSQQEPTTTTPVVSGESVNTPIGEVEEGVLCYEYAIDSMLADWFVEKDQVYMLFRNTNRYVVFDTNSGDLVIDKPLSGRPGKMRRYGNELWISFPDLCSIKVYNITDFSLKKTMHLQKSVHAFDVYEDDLFFSEDDQHVQVYRYNLKNGTVTNIPCPQGRTFYNADVLVNREHGLFYIGDSGSTGSALYCYDAKTLECKSIYRKNNYGYDNPKRRIYLSDGYVYWGAFKINALDVTEIEAQYGGGMLHVDDYFVVTTRGIYLKDTCEQLLEGNFNSVYHMIVITQSGNILLTEHKKLYIISQQIE